MKNYAQANIVLAGPMAAGKSTLARRLARLTKRQLIDVDSLRWDHLPGLGYSEALAEKAYQSDGVRGWFEYIHQFEPQLLHLLLEKHDKCIFDLGAGYLGSQKALSLFRKSPREKYRLYVILPALSPEVSYQILEKRLLKRSAVDIELTQVLSSSPGYNLNRNFIEFYSTQFPPEELVYLRKKKLTNSSLKKIFL